MTDDDELAAKVSISSDDDELAAQATLLRVRVRGRSRAGRQGHRSTPIAKSTPVATTPPSLPSAASTRPASTRPASASPCRLRTEALAFLHGRPSRQAAC
eukprot:scaffold21309_cov23-Phaeocystis_antarctica.AAC.1